MDGTGKYAVLVQRGGDMAWDKELGRYAARVWVCHECATDVLLVCSWCAADGDVPKMVRR